MRQLIYFLFILSISSYAIGADYYIDPDCGTPGDGTSPTCSGSNNDPFDDWTDVTWAAGNRYYQKRGTTWTGKISSSDSGSAGNEITIGAYGEGARPIVIGSVSDFALSMAKSHFVIENIEFRNTGYTTALFYSSEESQTNITVQNCKFLLQGSSQTNIHACHVLASLGDTSDFVFLHNKFESAVSGDSGSNCMLRFENGSTGIYDIVIQGNSFTGHGRALRFYGVPTNIDANGTNPYGIDINNNTFSNVSWSAITTDSGLFSSPNQSYIRNNIATECGDPKNDHVNCFQLSWLNDAIVEKNTINNVYTSAPDGCGIIIDWSDRNIDYMSDGVIVRWNKTTGSDMGDANSVASGIQIYAGKNCMVYGNVSYGNRVGIANMRDHSTGNVFYNNTIADNVHGGNSDNGGLENPGAPASTWINNIFANNSTSNFRVAGGSALPTESYNIFFGSLTDIVGGTIDGTDITRDPQFTSDAYSSYAIKASSPANKAGLYIDGYHNTPAGQTDFANNEIVPNAIPIGAYNYIDPNEPEDNDNQNDSEDNDNQNDSEDNDNQNELESNDNGGNDDDSGCFMALCMPFS